MIRPRSSKYDVIVVGAGNAAMTAAISARQNGARVLVLEKPPRLNAAGIVPTAAVYSASLTKALRT